MGLELVSFVLENGLGWGREGWLLSLFGHEDGIDGRID